MEISTIIIISVTAFMITVIISGAIRHFRSKESKSDLTDFGDLFTLPSDAVKEFEPLKSHLEVMKKCERTRDALYRAILRNLEDNGYYEYAHPAQSVRHYKSLPTLLELQNIWKFKPFIKELEDQYKRFDDAENTYDAEHEWVAVRILRVTDKLRKDQEFKDLVSSRGIDNSKHRNRDLHDLIRSSEAKGIVERVIEEVLRIPHGES